MVKSAGVAEVVDRLAGEAGLLGSKIDFDLQVQIVNMKQAGAEEWKLLFWALGGEEINKSAGVEGVAEVAEVVGRSAGGEEELVGEKQGQRGQELGCLQLTIIEMSQKSCPRGPPR